MALRYCQHAYANAARAARPTLFQDEFITIAALMEAFAFSWGTDCRHSCLQFHARDTLLQPVLATIFVCYL